MSVNEITNQREITPKNKQNRVMVLVYDVVLLCFMTHHLTVLYNCKKFHSNSLNCFQVKARTQNRFSNNQREITLKVCKAELWFLCMTRCLNVLYNCMKFHQNIFNGYQIIERIRFCDKIANDQRVIIPKINTAELLFLCMTHHFIVLYNCMKFHSNSCNGFQLTEWKRNSIANDQREIT